MAVCFEVMDDFECREQRLGRAGARIVERTPIIPKSQPGVGRADDTSSLGSAREHDSGDTAHPGLSISRVSRVARPGGRPAVDGADQMTSRIRSFEASAGGAFRISLTYDTPTTTGKTNHQTDAFHGNFIELVPDTKVRSRNRVRDRRPIDGR